MLKLDALLRLDVLVHLVQNAYVETDGVVTKFDNDVKKNRYSRTNYYDLFQRKRAAIWHILL